jgi:hypothetical protein
MKELMLLYILEYLCFILSTQYHTRSTTIFLSDSYEHLSDSYGFRLIVKIRLLTVYLFYIYSQNNVKIFKSGLILLR